jgi:PEP-CTERM motif-containing protein
MKTIPFLLALFISSCVAATSTRADEILLGTPHLLSGGISSVNLGIAKAEGFYLTQTVTLTGINIGIFSDTERNPDLFRFQLTNRIGPGTTYSNILASFLVGGSAIPIDPLDYCGLRPGCVSPYLSLTLPPLLLQSGEYFVVGAEVYKPSGFGGAAWQTESSALPSTVGGIGPTFYGSNIDTTNPSNSTWSAYTDKTLLDFQLLGTVSKAPEPSSLMLLGTGVLALLAVGRRKRRPLHS